MFFKVYVCDMVPLPVVNGFQQETDGAETVVAGNHGRAWILHPAVVEIAATGRQLGDERFHYFPCAVTQVCGLAAANGYELLTFGKVTGMFNGVLIQV